MKISIIIPVYNEEKNILDFVQYIYSSPCPLEREFIFIDDCSNDKSLELLKSIQKQYNFKLLILKKNQGKGNAIISGIREATGNIIMVQDADFEYDPRSIPSLLIPLIENEADVVYGSRFKENSPQVHRTFHYFGNRFLTIISNIFSGIHLTDMETCYKIFKADLLKSMALTSKRFGIEVEITAYLAKTSARIYELPINYHPRTVLQGKKIGWKDGVAALVHLVRFNFFTPHKKAFRDLPERYNLNRSKFEIFKELKKFK